MPCAHAVRGHEARLLEGKVLELELTALVTEGEHLDKREGPTRQQLLPQSQVRIHPAQRAARVVEGEGAPLHQVVGHGDGAQHLGSELEPRIAHVPPHRCADGRAVERVDVGGERERAAPLLAEHEDEHRE
jgi:hypothetical protein